MSKRNDSTPLLDKKTMVDSIKQSGYLIEKRVAKILFNESYDISANQVFIDSDSGKRREFDLSAVRWYPDPLTYDYFGYELICECENNQDPIVFFSQDFDVSDYVSEIKYSGLYSLLSNLLKKPIKNYPFSVTPFSTQYCNFQLTNKNNTYRWIAVHSDAQHSTFEKLLKIIKHRRKDYLHQNYRVSNLRFQVHHLLIVLQGEMYILEGENEENIVLKETNHVKYRISDYDSKTGNLENYYIDVVKETSLRMYLQQIERESLFVFEIIKKHRQEIIQELKKLNLNIVDSV